MYSAVTTCSIVGWHVPVKYRDYIAVHNHGIFYQWHRPSNQKFYPNDVLPVVSQQFDLQVAVVWQDFVDAFRF